MMPTPNINPGSKDKLVINPIHLDSDAEEYTSVEKPVSTTRTTTTIAKLMTHK